MPPHSVGLLSDREVWASIVIVVSYPKALRAAGRISGGLTQPVKSVKLRK